MTGTDPTNVKEMIGYWASATIAKGTDRNCGFFSELPKNDDDKNFNFFAVQDAPNFFRGDTYIGGSVSRNTRELWESTLTEEQKEQLSAGTLAIPANVSVPGDGSFARQWWYNQQSAEDQALIDSGELDYPSHFQAANFVDTFALGDATNIDFIAADGTVKLKGISFNKGATTADKIDFNGFYFSNFHNCPLLLASCHSDSDTEVTALKVTPYAYYPETDKNKNLTKAIGLYLESPIVTQGDNDDALLDDIRTIGIQGHDAAKLSENGSSYCISSFQNNPGSAEIALGKTAYNFYADGTAPNYFSGTVIVSKDTNSTSEILGGTKAGMYFNASTGGIAINKDDNNGNLNLMQCMRGGTATTRRFLDFRFSGTTNKLIGWIDATESAVAYRTTSDYRLKENIAPIISASDRVKQLNPCTFNFIGVDETVEGFIAHEIQEVVPATTSGTKDETEAIGTLTDWDGTELETNVTEPEDLTYTEEVTDEEGVATQTVRTRSWSATGTRDVYQGVDQTKLIPLLTKALQEALDRIEELESNTLQPLYATLADLPDASDHHGKVAHVHSEGALYFAHAGSWVKLQNA